MSDQMKQALCCECGAVRTCRRPRNHRAENYWLTAPINGDWHRETGDLKCDECSRITTHAIIHPEKDTFRDHAERLTRIALGSTTDPMASNETVRARIQSVYRQGREPNPLLNHLWTRNETATARESGRGYVIAHCGEKVALPDEVETIAGDSGYLPDVARCDQEYEYEDPATGLSWAEMYCVDCYRAANERRIARRRELLNQWLVWVYAKPDERVPDDQVDTLIAALEATQQKKSEDSTR